MLGHRQLADVVQQRRRLDRLRVEFGEVEVARQRRGVVLHALDVRGCRRVLGLNRARQHLGALAMELRPLRDAPLFVGDATR